MEIELGLKNVPGNNFRCHVLLNDVDFMWAKLGGRKSSSTFIDARYKTSVENGMFRSEIDYEQPLFFLIVRQEWSEKMVTRESWGEAGQGEQACSTRPNSASFARPYFFVPFSTYYKKIGTANSQGLN